MLPHVSVRQAALRAAATATLLAMMFVIAGCADRPPCAGAAAAEPTARIAAVRERSVLDGYISARPVEPAPWTGAPKTEGAQ